MAQAWERLRILHLGEKSGFRPRYRQLFISCAAVAVLRADHIGSLLRPARLLEARRSGDPELLRQIEEAILRVFANQKELGFGAATDGEFRRRNFMSDFTDAVEGIDLGDAVGRQWHAEQTADAPMSSVTGIVTSNRPLTGHELAFLKANSPQQGLSV